MTSLKTNVILNLVNTVTGIVFPVITFPYAARVLLPTGIGIVNFQLSIVNYIVLLTSLGIPLYAVKEVARHRDDTKQRNQVTVELLILSLLLCIIGYIVVVLVAHTIPQVNIHAAIFYLLSSIIFFTSAGVQWFYQAIEDFKFITIRAIIVRIIATVLLFIFVRESDDLLWYAAITVASTVGNNIINFFHLRSFISLSSIKWKSLNIVRHIKPTLKIFVLNVIISLYVNLNTVMLGFLSTEKAVGLYTAGTRLSHVVLTLVTSLGVVMLPRCSNLIECGQQAQFSEVANKGLHLVICMSLPLSIGLMLLAHPIIVLFCGNDFIGATPVLLWSAPIIFFVGLTNLIGIQMLYPQNKENIVIWSTVGAAIFNLLLNLFLIPYWQEVGAAIASCVAEFVVLIIQCWAGRNYLPFRLFDKNYLQYTVAALIMTIAVFISNLIFDNTVWKVTIGTLIGAISYGIVLFCLRNKVLIEILRFSKITVTGKY